MTSKSAPMDPFDSFDDEDDFSASYHQDQEDEDDFTPPASTTPGALSSRKAQGEMRDPFSEERRRPSGSILAQSPTSSAKSARPAEVSVPQDPLDVISIPRIGIHFYMLKPMNFEASMAASEDRRMQRAECLVRSGGIDQALATYRQEPTPSLIIVESASRQAALLEELGALADVCDTGTKVIVIGSHNDIGTYRELMAQGVSDYIVGPIKPLQIIRAIGNIFNDPEVPFVGRTIAFVGARGGAGSSSIAHNFAYNVSELMLSNTVIVDFDLAFGTASLDFNQDSIQGLAEALEAPDRLDNMLLDRMLIKCSDRLSLFSSPASLDQDYISDEDAFSTVTRKVRASAPFIVMDLPHLWTPWLKRNLIAADEVVIVATPDLASLRNAKNMIDLLKAMRPNDVAPHLILNQTETPGRPEIPYKEFVNAVGVEPTAVIPFDAKLFGTASNNGQMIAEVGVNSKVHEGIMALTCTITGRKPEAKPQTSMLDKLFKKRT
jgi:pilus assembly protein CpaE